MIDELKQWEFDKGYAKGKADGREEAIDEIDRFACNDLRTDCTNADIRETIHFELGQLKEQKND